MATFTKYWTGTSGDKITITTPDITGDQTLSVVSDPNTQPTARSKTIDLNTTFGTPQVIKSLTVSQDKVLPQGTFVMVGNNNIMYTTDGGQTWT
jgi:hypothetical protein